MCRRTVSNSLSLIEVARQGRNTEMLSLTVNQVKVDAGPLITRFKDAETGDLVYAGVFSPVRWWRLWATLWVSNLLLAVVVGAPGLLLLRLGWRVLPKEVPWQDLVSVSGLGGFALLCIGLALTVAAVRCILFLLTSPLWFGQAAYLSHQHSYRIF
jgi:hypothetical protein